MKNSPLRKSLIGPALRALLCGAIVVVAAPAFAQEGAAQYKQKCQMCHGATGAGDTPTGKAMKIRSLSDAEVVKQTDAQLIEVTRTGRNKMPGYKDKMTEAQIKDVVAHIRTLQKK